MSNQKTAFVFMEIYFTKHAEEKFRVFARHGVRIAKRRVIQTIKNPERYDYSRPPLIIAQRDLDSSHVLRVVYKIESKIIVVITFYPGRKLQYEK